MAKQFITLIICLGGLICSQSNAASISDPTRPFVKVNKQTVKTKLKITKKQQLNAIFIKSGSKQAIINNKLYNKGDYFGGKKITAIRANSVELTGANEIVRLTLIDPIKKRISK